MSYWNSENTDGSQNKISKAPTNKFTRTKALKVLYMELKVRKHQTFCYPFKKHVSLKNKIISFEKCSKCWCYKLKHQVFHSQYDSNNIQGETITIETEYTVFGAWNKLSSIWIEI